MKLFRACLAFIGLSLSLFAFADPTTPSLQTGQFVYQSPEGYMPPRVSQAMLDDLQEKAVSRHYPFYVILTDRVDDDQAASRIGNAILTDWARNSSFDVQRSSLFLVSFEGDRKFRLFPAPEWRSKLGLEKNESGDTLVQFTNIFLQSAKSGNPVEGISGLMEAYDSYIFDRIDPARVAQLEQEAESRRRQNSLGALVLVAIGGLITLIVVGRKRRAVYVRERSGFAKDVEAWKAKISGARLRYYDKIYNDENEIYSQKLREYPTDSETGKLYQATAQETDAIISQVEALSIHVDACEALARKASSIRLAPLRQAAKRLVEPFEFDTQQISSKLMDPMNSTISVDPHAEEESLNNRFEQVIQSWEKLKRALNNSNIPASELFKHDDLDAMIAKARDNGIPLRWLKEHPLYGDATEDQALFTVLEGPRRTDPVLYCREVERQMGIQSKIGEDLDRLIAAKRLAVSEEVAELSGFEGTLLGPDDDPKITLDRARQNQDRLAGLFESADSVDEVEQQAQKVHSLFQTCNAQAGAARSAIASAHQEIEKAKAVVVDLEKREKDAEAAIEVASKVYANTAAAVQALEAGRRHLATGKDNFEQAAVEVEKKAHLAGLRLATDASGQFASCRDRFQAVDRSIADLAKAKRQYEKKLREMDGLYDDAVNRVRQYNGVAGNIRSYQKPAAPSGPADYVLLASMLASQEQSWETEVLNAKREYDLEIARQQAEEERRREASSSSSWSSSDSGGSWSSGGGDSGGSWSSGGGDSGGSW